MPELRRHDGETIAYEMREGKAPGIVWLGGFKSDMAGTKATALDAMAARESRALLRFDYFGHGKSSGEFRKGTITRWREDALEVFDALTQGPQILVGSSMGGWISLLLARARPERIAGMLLLAPAPDFTEALMWPSLPDDAKKQIMEQGEWSWPSEYDEEPYLITRTLIEDGRKNLILHERISLPFPVRILQGMKDSDVPWRHAVKLVEAIDGDVRLTLVKDGDHRLSTPRDLILIEETLKNLIADIETE
ncbi:MAG TPA: alpha/beta hydrolase [Rhizomicrobium sp.]|nr:alpha/beta hydrolase [Rhizomicrobium sp.]